MKKIVLIYILSIIFFYANAQDIILKNNGEEISANILEITPELVKYKDTNLSDGPLFSIYKKDIKNITFKDGNVMVLTNDKPVSNNKSNGKYNTYTITDSRDSKKYKIVKIGEQDWFAENLSFKTNSSLVYDNDEDYEEIYGRLYYFEDALKACPDGWHLPSDEEWKELEVELGMKNGIDDKGWRGTTPGQGRLLKKGGSSNFNAALAGFSNLDITYVPPKQVFRKKEKQAIFWTGSENIEKKKKVWIRLLEDRSSIMRTDFQKKYNYGLSVRCIKNKEQ